MSNDPSPLKYMGTQSQETVDLAAAIARDGVRSTEPAVDQAMKRLSDRVEDAILDVPDVATAVSETSDAASWRAGKAMDTLQSAAEQVRERSITAVATSTKADPIRAILIAAGAGALLMGFIVMTVRSGVRAVKRNVQRYGER